MSTVLYKSDYLTIEYYPEDKIMTTVWNVDSLDFTLDDFYKEIVHYIDSLQGKEVKGFLIDTRNYDFPMTDDVNTWLSENITPAMIKAGVEKTAYVMPKEFVSRLGIELLIDKVNAKGGIVRKVFEDFDQAFEWLKK